MTPEHDNSWIEIVTTDGDIEKYKDKVAPLIDPDEIMGRTQDPLTGMAKLLYKIKHFPHLIAAIFKIHGKTFIVIIVLVTVAILCVLGLYTIIKTIASVLG